MPPLRLSALGVLLAACPPAAEPEPAPDVPGCISLEPPELAFPDVDLTADGEHWTALDLEIRNDCDGDLIVHSMTVDGHGVYLSGFLGGSVAARSSALTTVTFEPKQPGEIARSMGFKKVASGPFVRSSYHARDMAENK